MSAADRPSAPLAGLRVVELGAGIAAAYCGKLLVDVGACVVKVETVKGDPLRRFGPIPEHGRERGSGLFQYLNSGKKSVAADFETAADRELLSSISRSCDVIVEDLGPGGFENLPECEPAALVRISPFGQRGPYCDRRVTSLVLQAAGGWAARIGTAAGPPYHVAGRLEEYIAGAYGAAAAVSALTQWRRTGKRVDVDVSIFECLVGTIPYPMLQKITFDRLGFPVPQRYQPIPGIMRCRAGHVGINALTGQHWADVCALMGAPELAQKMREVTLREAEWSSFRAKAEPWLAERNAAEVVELCQAMRVPAVPVGNGANLATLEPFRSRGFYVEQPGSSFVRPRAPFIFGATPAVEPRPSPLLDEHRRELADLVHASASSAARGQVRPAQRPAAQPSAGMTTSGGAEPLSGPRHSAWGGGRAGLPFSGLRVLDVTSFWAGPYLTMYLASMGADVIKVESPRRPDGFRFVAAFPQLGARWWEQSGVYHATNLGKRTIAVDLDREQGLAIIERLIADADVLIENYSPRVIENFGLDYDAVRALNSRIVMLRMPAFGLSGPCRDWVGWAVTFEQLAGCATVTGERAGAMFNPGGFADPVVGMHAAVALQAALAHRDRTGEGQLIEIAQVEVVASLTAEQVIRHSISGEVMERNGNRSSDMAPQGIYRCGGNDEWIALSVRDDEDWQKLRRALDDPEWARSAHLATLAGRVGHQDELDGRLQAWASRRSSHDAERTLCAAGVPAAALLKTEHMYGEPQLEARRYYQELDHAVCGPQRFPGWPMRFSFLPDSPYATGAPTLGQHNEEILRDVLGMSDAAIAELRATGVIGETMEQ